jgi:hypothetical protein
LLSLSFGHAFQPTQCGADSFHIAQSANAQRRLTEIVLVEQKQRCSVYLKKKN